MVSRRLRLWLAILVFIVAAVALALALLPSPRIQQVQPVPPVILPTQDSPSSWLPFDAAWELTVLPPRACGCSVIAELPA